MGAERRLQTRVLAGYLAHINLARLFCEQRLLLQLGIGAAVGLQRQDKLYVAAALRLEACVLELVGRSGTESVRYGVRVVQGASGVKSSSCGFRSAVQHGVARHSADWCATVSRAMDPGFAAWPQAYHANDNITFGAREEANTLVSTN